MQPKKCYYSGQFSLLSPRLDTIINMQHELVKLTQTIEWQGLENHFTKFYSTAGRSGVKNPPDVWSSYIKAYIQPV